MRHSTRVKGVAALGALAAGALALSGCTTGEAAATGEIRILANITPVLTVEYYEDLVQPFVDANPGVTVTIEVPSAENVQTTLQQQLASGDIPDIIASAVDPVVAPQLLPFPEEEWVLDTPLADANRVDGSIISVATGAQIQSLVFYNVDAFEAAGIEEIPASLDEFTEAMQALQAAGYVPLQTAGEWVTGAQFAMMANPSLLGEEDFYAERNAGDATFVGSAYEEYLEAYAGWIADGLVPADSLGLKYQDSIDGFTSGRSAMFVMGNWIVPSIDAAAPAFEVGVFSVPTPDGAPGGQLSGGAQPYSILKDSPNTELALELVEYLVTDEEAIAKSLVSEGNFRQGVSYDASPLTQAVAAVLDEAPVLVIGTAGPQIPGGFADELNKAVQSLYLGTSASDAAAALDNWWTLNAVQ